MKKLFVTVLIIRLLLMLLPSFQIDMGGWRYWAMRMVEVGPQNFYSTKIFTDNPPGYLYVFGVIGKIREIWGIGGVWFDWLLKLPANLFDLGTGVIIYKIIEGKLGKAGKLGGLGILGFLGYTLNPAIWFNSSVFGQFDGAGAFFGLLAVYLILEKKRLGWAAVAFAFAWAVKPQAIALAPGIGILALTSLKSPKFLKLLRAGIAFLVTTLLLYWPFFPKNPIAGVFYVFSRMNNIYSCTTCFAFNFWGMWGNWGNDQVLFLGIPLMIWGIILAIFAISVIFLKLLRHPELGSGSVTIAKRMLKKFQHDEINYGKIYLAIALSVMAFFMFVTRMHERYLLIFFPFMLLSAMLLKSKALMFSYLFISGLSLLNVYYPYANYNTDLHLTPGLVIWLGENFRILSMISFGSFLGLWGWSYVIPTKAARSGRVEESNEACGLRPRSLDSLRSLEMTKNHPLKETKISRTQKIILVLILLFAFFSRVWRLGTPPTFYFDEVYHAFTAREMLLGNKMAWEWWNTPPTGFAYEWTHPPLAKEAMVLGIRGIRIIREMGGVGLSDAFGWRLPGVLAGAGVIFLIYLLGKELFNPRVGLIAAFLGSCDGLLFTQSRIGMNDIYFLFFMLLAFWLFIKSQTSVANGRGGNLSAPSVIYLFLMSISLGLSLASKWTAIYGIGILGGLFIISELIKLIKAWPLEAKRPGLWKLITVFLLTFIIIPISIYLISYLPFFTSGHTWAQFDELQHQMWWYHTGLRATHPYSSPWYSWPLMQRPVWYYVNYGGGIGGNGGNGGTVANIYDLGNPLIWWAGVVAVGWMVWCLAKTGLGWVVSRGSGMSYQGGEKKPHNPQPITHPLLIVLLGYFGFFLPWALSPRIMFLYHYLPSLPFLFLALGWGLDQISQIGLIGQIGKIRISGKLLVYLYLLVVLVVFVYFYPLWSALPVSKSWADQYFWFGTWR